MKEAAPGDVNFLTRSFVCVLILSKSHLKQFHRCHCGSSCSSKLFSFVEWWWPRYYHQISKCWRRAPRFDDVAIEGEEFHFFLLCRGNAATTAAAQLWQQLLLLWKAPLIGRTNYHWLVPKKATGMRRNVATLPMLVARFNSAGAGCLSTSNALPPEECWTARSHFSYFGTFAWSSHWFLKKSILLRKTDFERNHVWRMSCEVMQHHLPTNKSSIYSSSSSLSPLSSSLPYQQPQTCFDQEEPLAEARKKYIESFLNKSVSLSPS